VVAHRGCYGGCTFCTLTLHQGKQITSRSQGSILKECREVICTQTNFDGTILDVGGPTANMYGSICGLDKECQRLSCLFPAICPQLEVSQTEQSKLLKKISQLPKVKHVFINSGIRYDLALREPAYIQDLAENYVSGQLSMAPEHSCAEVLKLMHKPSFDSYSEFAAKFLAASKRAGKEQYIIPYFISGHPGTTLADMYRLSLYLRQNNLRIRQVQSFIPIPMTLAAAMYYTGRDLDLKPIHIAKGQERTLQRALLQPWLPGNHRAVRQALKILKRDKDFSYLTGGENSIRTEKKKFQRGR
jgi:uncharacterized radical SAM protein YgiQ